MHTPTPSAFCLSLLPPVSVVPLVPSHADTNVNNHQARCEWGGIEYMTAACEYVMDVKCHQRQGPSDRKTRGGLPITPEGRPGQPRIMRPMARETHYPALLRLQCGTTRSLYVFRWKHTTQRPTASTTGHTPSLRVFRPSWLWPWKHTTHRPYCFNNGPPPSLCVFRARSPVVAWRSLGQDAFHWPLGHRRLHHNQPCC